jgi:hypothetical protein
MSLLAEVRRTVADRIAAAGIDSVATVHAYPPKDFALPTVLVLPGADPYVNYHGTFGAGRLMEINLTVRIMVAEGGSPQSGAEYLDSFLSSGTAEDIGLADAIAGTNIDIDGALADIYAGSAENFATGQLERATTTPVYACDIPVLVHINRS